MSHVRAFAASTAVLGMLIGGCAGQGDASQSAKSSPAATASSSAAAHGAPEFAVRAFTGDQQTVELAALRAKGPVVVNFFESWCPTCANEQRDINATATTYAGRVSFVGISNHDTVEDGRHYAEIFNVPYPMAHAPEVWKAYGVPYQPVTVVIARDGQLLKRWAGAVSGDELSEVLERALTA